MPYYGRDENDQAFLAAQLYQENRRLNENRETLVLIFRPIRPVTFSLLLIRRSRDGLINQILKVCLTSELVVNLPRLSVIELGVPLRPFLSTTLIKVVLKTVPIEIFNSPLSLKMSRPQKRLRKGFLKL